MNQWLSRLRLMTRDEVSWRARVFARTRAQRLGGRLRPPRWDRALLGRVLAADAHDGPIARAIDAEDWQSAHEVLLARIRGRSSRFVLDSSCPDALVREVRARWPDAAARAACRADRILGGRYDVLGYQDVTFAGPDGETDWHRDPVHGRRAPVVFWADVPYLDPRIGDHKIIWELNRHQHWLQLGRALWLTNDPRYRRGILAQFESWLAANPPLVGINWASMLEIGLRALSWIWALHFLIADRTARPEPPWLVDMLVALDQQLTHVERNLSHYFSPNTHLTGEALALYVVGHALPELAASDRWADRGRAILLGEIDRQIRADGGHVECSTHYHRYTLDMYLLALLVATRTNDSKALPEFTAAVTRLAEFMRAVADDRGFFPLIGDDDGGMLWPMTGRACHDVRDSLALAAVVLGRPDLAAWEVPEEVFWLGGRTASDRADLVSAEGAVGRTAPSRTFPDSGIVVTRDRNGGHAVFDAGPHGYLNGGHAHADALALTLSIGNRRLLLDPGTATYTLDRKLRDRMRGAANHNTVIVDGRPQSAPDGPFRWRTRTDARLHGSRHSRECDWAEASHDAYAPLRHRRTLVRASGSGWLVLDEVLGGGRHRTSTYWHFDPDWVVTAEAPGCLRAIHADAHIAWLLTEARAVQLARGDDSSGLGWCAPAYGTLIPTWSAEVRQEALAPFALVTWIGTVDGDEPPTLERLPATSGGARSAIGARITAGDRTSVFLLRPGHSASLDMVASVDFETDARVVHCATRAGALLTVDLIDGSRLHARHDGWLSVAADAAMPSLHLGLEDALLDLIAPDPPAQLRLSGRAIAGLHTLRLNGREMEFASEPSGSLTVDRAQWTAADWSASCYTALR